MAEGKGCDADFARALAGAQSTDTIVLVVIHKPGDLLAVIHSLRPRDLVEAARTLLEQAIDRAADDIGTTAWWPGQVRAAMARLPAFPEYAAQDPEGDA